MNIDLIETKVAHIFTTLWIGALWSVGVVAYVLFDNLSDKQLAGMLAGKLFTIVSYLGMVSGFYLLIHRLVQHGMPAFKEAYFWVVLIMLTVVLIGHFGIQPVLSQLKTAALPNDVMHSVFAGRFRAWHGVASVAYVVQCLLGLVVVLKTHQSQVTTVIKKRR